MIYKICKNAHNQIMGHVLNSSGEHGGSLKVVEREKLLVIDNTHSQGDTHSVVIPCSRIEWHTHPKKCTKNVCALALPSSEDMKLCLIRGKTKKCEVHFVYTYLGIFVIYCIQSSKTVKKDPVSCEQEIESYWQSHKKDFESEKLTIDDYLPKWISKINSLGFVVEFFENNNNLNIPYCALKQDV